LGKTNEEMKLSLPQVRPKIVKPTKAEQEELDRKAQEERIKANALAIRSKLIKLAPVMNWNTWDAIEKHGPVVVPDMFKSQPFSYIKLNEFLELYVNGAVSYAAQEREQALARTVTKIEVRADKIFGQFKLRPRQQKALDFSVNVFLKGEQHAVYLPLPTGAGKSIIAGAFIKELQTKHSSKLGMIPSCRFLFITKKKPRLKIERTFKDMGIKGVGMDVRVISYGDLYSAKPGKFGQFFKDKIVNIRGNDAEAMEYDVNSGAPNWNIIIIDEGHVAKKLKSKAAQQIHALKEALPNAFFMWTSATPAVVMQDLQLFCITAGFKSGGVPVTRDTWPGFVAQFTTTPTEEDTEAFRAFAKYCGEDVWIRPPADKKKYKFNAKTVLLEFTSEKYSKIYYEAEFNYIEACKRAGEDKSLTNMKLTRFTLLRAAEEMCKAPHFVSRALQHYAEGYAPVIGVCFEDTLCDIVRGLVERGIPRDKICVIHGGRRKVNPADLLSPDEESAIFAKRFQINEDRRNGIKPTVELTKEEKRRWKITVDYRRDRLKRDETKAEAAERQAVLATLKLAHQTDDVQQKEIDEFQAGKRLFAVYTFASGGTGIDLDDQLGPPTSRPRYMDSTVCYYGEEFVQSSGRVAREGTVTDVHFDVLFFVGTIAAGHVAPTLLRKLHAIQTLAAGTVDLTESLEDDIRRGKVVTAYKAEEMIVDSGEIEQLEEGNGDDDDDDDDKEGE